MTLTEAREHFGVREWGHRAPLAVRLLRKVEQGGDCWLWTGATTDGYGRVMIRRGQPVGLTHRAAYELFVGPVPDGLHLDHLCRVRACCNPAHLEPVTSRENNLRGVGWAGLNAAKTHCTRGHEFTSETTRLYDGRRYCRLCVNAARREAKAA